MKALEIKNLTKSFGSQQVLKGVTLTVEQGEIFGYLGPNGAGKTTTIRAILDFIRPNSGSIRVFGHNAQADGIVARTKLSYLSSENNLYGNWSGNQHIDYVCSLRPTNQARLKALKDLLDFDGVPKVHHLSTGNRQKLGILLAFAPESQLLILDEPTRGLDPLLQNALHQVLRDYRDGGGTVFMSSHNLAEVEEVCSRVAIIRSGTIISDETIETIKAKSVYRVRLIARPKLDQKHLEAAGATEVVRVGRVVRLQLHGSPELLMHMLSKYEVEDIEISRQTLEEMFVEMYQ